jgi:hypothetical protein
MPLDAAALDADWSLFDNVEPVTVFGYDRAADAATGSGGSKVCDALRREQDGDEEPVGEGAVAVERLRWHLRKSQLDGPPGITLNPTKRAVIQDANGTRWVVENVKLGTFRTRYVCECHKE